MRWNQQSKKIAELIHQKSMEILSEVGFCVPEESVLQTLVQAGFIVDKESQMVRVTQELLDTALKTLPKDVKLYNRSGSKELDLKGMSHFMGAGTPVNVQDLETGERRAATRKDVRNFVILQDALSQVDIVRPTVTATDIGENSDLVEIAELLLHTNKPLEIGRAHV